MSTEEQESAGRPKLSEQEQKDVERRSAPRTEVVYEAIREEGETELRRAPSTLSSDGPAAWMSVGFSLVAEVRYAGKSAHVRKSRAWATRRFFL